MHPLRPANGSSIRLVTSGAKALSRTRKRTNQIEVLILDLMCPASPGSRSAAGSAATRETAPIPIIMVTTKADETDASRALSGAATT